MGYCEDISPESAVLGKINGMQEQEHFIAASTMCST
jgi:hypothetical protein